MAEVKQELLKRGIRIVVFNPCANTPTSSEFLKLMKMNIVSMGKR